MPDSPNKKTNALLPKRPDTKALNKLWENISSGMNKSPKRLPSRKLKSKNTNSPTAKKYESSPSQQTLTGTGWISKPNVKLLGTTNKSTKGIKETQEKKMAIHESPKPLKIKTTKVGKSTSTSSSNESVTNNGKPSKKSSKPTFKRFNSASSDELPTFKEKTSRKRPKHTETFKKYGVIIPSLDEIVADQKQFTCYKTQVEEAQTLKEPTFKMPLSPQKSHQVEDKILLDCKQISLKEITCFFNKNIPFLQDIINGKKFSDRHKRYFDKKNKLDDLTTKDLTYNTSTIVFTFEQIDLMISLMQTKFDPEDKKTGYFFKVLVPELCLKIFMETHDMNKREANAYLENRPVD